MKLNTQNHTTSARRILRTIALVAPLLTAPVVLADDTAKQRDFFESKIRPVLIKHCYSCHSADAKEIKGGLRLDTAAGLLHGGESGPSLVAKKPDESLLIDALRFDGLKMPPAGRLPNQIVADFEKWVRTGAFDPRTGPVHDAAQRQIDIAEGRRFWAFQPFSDTTPPKTIAPPESQSSIDAFVTHRLESAGLQPVQPADRFELVRRLYFDLTGLPPSPADLTSAVEDTSDRAIETLVDRMLASPRFGVNWGRHWLDVARYADSNGGDFNATFHNAWRYRDYVVESVNNDKPFDRFVREQVAGDLLPFENDAQRAEQLIATGFLMIGTKMLSERDKDKLTMDVVDEQINTVGSAFLGMTLGCARCHDHKFDPIPTRDYYALAGIFRSTRTLEGESQKYVSTWTKTDLPAQPEHVAAVKAYQSRKKSLESSLKTAKDKLKQLKSQVKTGDQGLVDDAAAKKNGAWKSSSLTPRFIGRGYIHDDKSGKGQKSVEFSWTPPKTGTYEVRVSYTAGSTRATNVPVTIQYSDQTMTETVDQTRRPEIDETFSAVGRYEFTIDKPVSVRISNEGTKGFVIVDAVQFIEIDNEGRPVAAKKSVSESLAAKMAEQNKQIQSVESELKTLNSDAPPELPRAIAAVDLPKVDDCEICIRGEHQNRGAKVPRGFLQVVSPPQPVDASPSLTIPANESGRRELAEWIARSDNPLTARVIVNRVWHHLLGRGIVASVDNFGKLGDRPTHPELLDHLATRFVTPQGETTAAGGSGFGQSIKALIREIVLSDVYQRSTGHKSENYQTDPENKLLWKANRRRITAEGLRDAILAISEQLELSPGGSPVKGLGTLVKNNQPDADEYQSQESPRRSLYLPIVRNELPPILTVFDFADPDLVVGRRPLTNVPAQALYLMNSPFVMDSADRTAKKLCSDETRSCHTLVKDAYLTVLTRPPTPSESNQALNFLRIADGESTIADEHNIPTKSDAAPLEQRLSRLIHVLFASTEFRMLN